MQLSPRQRWKLQQYKNSYEAAKEQVRDLFKSALVKQKVCPACRALVGANETRCPFCNESVNVLNRIGVRRVARTMTGGGVSIVPDMNFSWTLVAINFVMFCISIVGAMKEGVALDGITGMPGQTLVNLGSNFGPYVLAGQYWRLITGAFLHGNLVHLLFNMWVLADIGPSVEEMYGQSRFITLYVWSALLGSVASVWWHLFVHREAVNMVGASGALFGLIGVMIAYGYSNRTGMAQQIRSMFIRWAIYGLVFGLFMGADNAAHIGGLIAGLLFGFVVSDMPPVTKESIIFWKFLNYASWTTIALCMAFMAWNLKSSLN